MLYIVSTPIGNLDDFSSRAIDTLKKCDYVLCEDTRHSLKLLQHYQIQKSLISFHQWNEANREKKVIEDLKSGKSIALISDAGTPLISDPGFPLVQACQREHLPVTAIPGACALITALVLSGFSAIPFQFIGFLPKKRGDLLTQLEELLEYPGTSICYESAERIEQTLSLLSELDPERKVAVARELTKRFETIHVDTAEKLLETQQKEPYIGELVFLIEGRQKHEQALFSKEFLKSCVDDVAQTHSVKEAILLVSQQLKVPKRLVYAAVHT